MGAREALIIFLVRTIVEGFHLTAVLSKRAVQAVVFLLSALMVYTYRVELLGPPVGLPWMGPIINAILLGVLTMFGHDVMDFFKKWGQGR